MANKKKNTGVPYEKLVHGIFQAIHDQEKVATITVEQNKTLRGKISTHQIDALRWACPWSPKMRVWEDQHPAIRHLWECVRRQATLNCPSV
jgi:hypothetical protein